MRQVLMNLAPSQMEKTVLVLPQSMANSMAQPPLKENVRRRDDVARN
jgi:hypothetical protein